MHVHTHLTLEYSHCCPNSSKCPHPCAQTTQSLPQDPWAFSAFSNWRVNASVQNEAGQRLTEFCQESALVIANTLFQQHRILQRTSPDGQHQNQTDYILCSHRWRSSIQSAKTRLGADCGSDHELLIAKFRFKLKKVGKTTRPFRYDLNQIPYNYTVKVRNRFKWLDLIDRVPDELWWRFMTLYRRQGSRPSPRKRNAKRQNGCLRKL